MKKFTTSICILALFFLFLNTVYSSSVVQEINRVASEVSALKLGFTDYILGNRISEEQKAHGLKQSISETLSGTYKFKDGDIYVIATEADDIVLGMYKEFEDTGPEQLKNIIGSLMFEYGEPTATAHDKMIYWTYNSNGKISQDEFEFNRANGGNQPLATIKFSSSETFGQSPVKTEKTDTTSSYLMITSDPLSKLFLAHIQQSIK